MFGLEDYYIDLLTEAKSPEEIKKILEYQFVQGKGVPQEVLDKVFEIDPTKKKSYTRWTLSQWGNASEQIIESIKNGMLERMFKTFKERQNSGLDLTNMKSFEEAMGKVPEVDHVLDKEGNPDAPENDFDIMYTSKDGQWIVALPHTFEADEKLGQGCRWCTADAFGDGQRFWDTYSSAGPLWINFDKTEHEVCPMDHKEYPYKRYQLLFEYHNWHGELMGCHDNRIDPSKIGMPEDVIEFYESQNERYGEILRNGVAKSEEERWQEYLEARQEMAREVFSTRYGDMALYLLPERNENMNLDDVPWHVYHSQDFGDPISNTEYDPDDCVELELENDEIVVLRDVLGEFHAYSCQERRYWSEYDDVFLAPIRNMYAWCLLSFNNELIIAPTNDNEVTSYIDIQKQLRFDGEVVTGFANEQVKNEMTKASDTEVGTYVEIVWNDGSHTLVIKRVEDDDVDFVIKRDFPVEGAQQFTASIEGEKVIIRGRLFEHNIMDANSGIMMDSDISEECGRPVYVVRYNETDMLNVYDATTKKMFFNFPLSNVETIGIEHDNKWYLRCTTPQEKMFIASTQDGKVLTAMFDTMRRAAWQSPFIIAQNDNERANSGNNLLSYVIVFNNGTCRTYGPFDSCAALDSNDRIVVRPINGGVNILNAETGEMMLKTAMRAWGKLGSGSYGDDDGMMVLQDMGGNFDLYDYENGKVIVPNMAIKTSDGKLVKPWRGKNRAWTIMMSDGKFNLVKDKHIVLPKNVDKIFRGYSEESIILDGNKLWLMRIDDNGNTKLLPSDNGIDVTNLKLYGAGDGHFKFRLNTTSGDYNYDIDYCPEATNGKKLIVLKVNLIGNEKVYVSEQDPIYRQIYSMFFPVASAVRENFNRAFKMITDFYKD